ncbi:MAG: hypothetical protein AAGH15_13500 [Myxococcota bacterium]
MSSEAPWQLRLGAAERGESAELKAQERRHGFRAPAAVQAWYASGGAEGLRVPGLPEPVPVDRLGDPRAWEGAPVPLLERELLVLAAERRGVSHHVAVWLDGTEDPPVFRERGSMPDHTFVLIGGTFSEWVLSRRLLRRGRRGAPERTGGTGRAAGDALLALAREASLEHVHFDGAHERVVVAAGAEGAPLLRFREDMNGLASWRIGARDAGALELWTARAARLGLPAERFACPSLSPAIRAGR